MRFCPKCSAMLLPKKDKSCTILACSCGYREKGEVRLREAGRETKKVDIISEEPVGLPVVDAKCKKCGNDQAYFWEIQTRAADEPATRFFKCDKCGSVWREYK